MIYVLICAGEGHTQAIVVAQTPLELRTCVADMFQQEIERFPLPWNEGNQGFWAQSRDALLRMLAQAPDTPGRHLLDTIEPQWERWTLVITEGAGAFLDD